MGKPEIRHTKLSDIETIRINHVAEELKIDPVDARKWLMAVGGVVFDAIRNDKRFYTVVNDSIHNIVTWPEFPKQISEQEQPECKG